MPQTTRWTPGPVPWLGVLLALGCGREGPAPEPRDVARTVPSDAATATPEVPCRGAPDAGPLSTTDVAAPERPPDDGPPDDDGEATTTEGAPAEAVHAVPPQPVGADGWVVCVEPPPGMACIPGGPFVRGDDRGEADERPAAEVEVSTFYLDRNEVTNVEFRRCMEAGACRLQHHYPHFNDPEQPVVAVDWHGARDYCAWAGKRLPTEAEWEKAARGGDGRRYPWGDEPPSCERAMYRGCEPEWARPVGSFAAGPWGLHDLAGNAYEFVQDWYAPCYRGCAGECGDACFGRDPRGPCGGAAECPGRERRVLRGGSWFWPADQLRAANRRGMRPDSGGHRLG
ncbi:MAG: SUMF1/EgtB/PvdO family nonheme iron enzyme, partial [Deltaproteobacteria bacterium]|nr:SUMF1/EgtB/PvdO family nonheme iron enzyme [Deltaproteobacteria bacterium]